MDWLRQYLDRVGHVVLENPVWLVGYTGRLVASLRFTVAGALSAHGFWHLTHALVGQTVKTFFRGVFLVVALGAASAIGMAWVSARLGGLARGAFDQLVVPLLVSDVLPLGLAVVLVARTGATIAVGFAIRPLEQGTPVQFDPRALQREVVPHLFASVVTAGLFYAVAVWLLLAGYHATGFHDAFRADLSAYFSPSAAWAPFWSGARMAVLFGAVVAWVSSGLGIQVAERHHRVTAPAYPTHYVVWETVLLVTMTCTLLTLLL